MPQPPDPNQNIEQQIDEILDDVETNILGIKYDMESDESMRIADVHEHITAIKKVAANQLLALISKQVSEARIGAVTELKRRWNDDRKFMDYVPDTYQFICDKYLAELKQTPPTLSNSQPGPGIVPASAYKHKCKTAPTSVNRKEADDNK